MPPAQHYVQLDELADAVGRRLAELTGAEWGMVSAGCAAGLKHVTAACVAGGNPEKLLRIPDLTGLDKTEVVIPRSSRSVVRSRHPQHRREDHHGGHRRRTRARAQSADGDDLPLRGRTIHTRVRFLSKTLPKSRSPGTSRSWWMRPPRCSRFRMCTCSAAPPWWPTAAAKPSADRSAPGCCLGRKDILMSAWQASSPHHGPGRDNKVGREETIGMLAAVEAWVKRDHKAEWNKWLSYLDTISKRVSRSTASKRRCASQPASPTGAHR